jgi:NADPH:quinone reductase-like Zn-dependent oxidoreductase
MKAMQVVAKEHGLEVSATDRPQPTPGAGEVLIEIHAAGVIQTELEWGPTTQTKDGKPRTDAIPAHEFSGVIAACGADADQFSVGQAVYGMNDWYSDGALAEFCVTQASSIAIKPASISDVEAAAVPISALTAWQGLLSRAKLQRGESVLIHGGSGGVGTFAIQIAKLHGARVIATASGANLDVMTRLGADEVIDYKTTRFETVVSDIDVVFDTVGGDTLARSWDVLGEGGRVVTVSSDGESQQEQRVKDAFFIVEPNQQQLVEVARLIDGGKLKVLVRGVVPLADAELAYNGNAGHQTGYGKTVVSVRSIDFREGYDERS